nr:probable tRNA-splicing endonuclease subunit tsp-2 [Danaus plexippus plexippus]
MTSMQSKDCCQMNEKSSTSMDEEKTLRFPLVDSMCILFTGYFNGVGVEIRSTDAMALLHHIGCYGKGNTSKSRPKVKKEGSPIIMRKRQFLKRSYWYKRFGNEEKNEESDFFFKDVYDLIKKIKRDTKKGVIDLVSSDDDGGDGMSQFLNNHSPSHTPHEQDIVVVVANSDSEDDNYFANLKPQCCLNKVSLQEKLMLTLQEAFFLVYGLGCLKIVKEEDQVLNIEECWSLFCNTDKYFVSKYIVYHHFRSKGYVVKSGIKFGGDFLLYKEGPEVNHADYIVVIKTENDTFNWISLLGHVRMATTTVKEVMIAEVKSEGENLRLPHDLCKYSVRELVLSRNLPVINNEID